MSVGSGGGIAKFLVGVAAGMALSYGYVRWGIELPAFFQAPGQLRDNIVSTTAEEQLYDLAQPLDARTRALEVIYRSRPKFAVEVDREAGHPFLDALYRRRVAREARQLRMAWTAFDSTLEKPALRQALERKHTTTDTIALKQAMLAAQLEKSPFLAAWLQRNVGRIEPDKLLAKLAELSRWPLPASQPAPPAIGSSPTRPR